MDRYHPAVIASAKAISAILLALAAIGIAVAIAANV